MLASPKFLMIAGVAALGVFAAVVFVLPNFLAEAPAEDSVSTVGAPPPASEFSVPKSGLLPPSRAGRLPLGGVESDLPESPVFRPPDGVSGLPAASQFEANIPSIEDITKAVGEALGSAVGEEPEEEILPLPPINEGEIAVVANGPADTLEYLEKVVADYREINFNYEKFSATIVREEDGSSYYPGPIEIIDAALAGGDFNKARSDLSVFREFLLAKIDFGKKVGVAAGGISAAQTIIGLDALTVDVIDKFAELVTGSLSRNDFEDFYAKYKGTNAAIGEDLFAEAQIFSYLRDGGFWKRIVVFLGLQKTVFAIAEPFHGGVISWITACTCAPSLTAFRLAPVTPQFPRTLGRTPASIIFPLHKPLLLHWLLGANTVSPFPCLQGPPACLPDPIIPTIEGAIIFTGTS